jgi:glucan phosphoethanolaminetransferase (alkaline phosphatase superfamily)
MNNSTDKWLYVRWICIIAIFVLHALSGQSEYESVNPGACAIIFGSVFFTATLLAYFGSRRRPTATEVWKSSIRSSEFRGYIYVHLFSWLIASAIVGLVVGGVLSRRYPLESILMDTFVFVALRLSLMVSGAILRAKSKKD